MNKIESLNNKPDPFIMVIFGASGDLTTRKLIPALFHLYCRGLMPERFCILGVSRTAFTDETFRDKEQTLLEATIVNSSQKALISSFFTNIFYLKINTMEESEYGVLKDRLRSLGQKLNIPANYLFYLATPPSMYEVIPQYLSKYDLQKEIGRAHV